MLRKASPPKSEQLKTWSTFNVNASCMSRSYGGELLQRFRNTTLRLCRNFTCSHVSECVFPRRTLFCAHYARFLTFGTACRRFKNIARQISRMCLYTEFDVHEYLPFGVGRDFLTTLGMSLALSISPFLGVIMFLCNIPCMCRALTVLTPDTLVEQGIHDSLLQVLDETLETHTLYSP